jgi:hypothetical protein
METFLGSGHHLLNAPKKMILILWVSGSPIYREYERLTKYHARSSMLLPFKTISI